MTLLRIDVSDKSTLLRVACRSYPEGKDIEILILDLLNFYQPERRNRKLKQVTHPERGKLR